MICLQDSSTDEFDGLCWRIRFLGEPSLVFSVLDKVLLKVGPGYEDCEPTSSSPELAL